MVRKRTEFEPIFLGKKKKKITYEEACELAKALDNLPPLKEDYKDKGE